MNVEASSEKEPCATGAGCVFACGVSAECEWGLHAVSCLFDGLGWGRIGLMMRRYQIYVSEERVDVKSMGKTEKGIRTRFKLSRLQLLVCLLHARCWKVRSSPPC